MNTQLLSEENSSAKSSWSLRGRSNAAINKLLITIFIVCPSFIFTGSAQTVLTENDSISAVRRAVICREARESDDWNDTYAVAMTASFTASGQGLYYSPLLISHSKLGYFSIGPCIQKQKGNFSGFQINYEKNLLEDKPSDSIYNSRIELYAFVNTSYHYNAILSSDSQAEETILNKTALNTTYLRSLEGYIGFGLRLKITPNLKWSSCIGFGGYKMVDAPVNLVHNKNGLGLIYRTGLSYEFNRDNRIIKRKVLNDF